MNVYIDFDRTLFDTDAFYKDLEKLLELNDISFNRVLEYAKKNSENGFNIYQVLDIMKKDINFNDDIYKKVDNLLKKVENYIYSDVYDFMTIVKKSGYKVFILTKGNSDYQLLKIRNTKLFNYLDGVIVTLKDKGELDLKYKESIFIDDNPRELESIMKKFPKRIIRIERDNAKYNDISVYKSIEAVNSLKDITI